MPNHDPIKDAVDLAIDDLRTNSPPGRDVLLNRWVFRFCQFLRRATNPDADDTDDLEPYLRLWYEACKEQIMDDEKHAIPYDVLRAQFHDIWDNQRVKYAANDVWQGILDQAKADATEHAELSRYSDPSVRLLGLCLYHASRLTPARNFFISHADAGRIMGKSHTIGGLILALFCADGLIHRLQKGHTHKASEYRFLA
jgi:hypothetical protein